MLPAVRRSPGIGSAVLMLSSLSAFLLFGLERGEAVDWDLGATLLMPAFLCLVALLSSKPGVLAPISIAAVMLASPRIGCFLDPAASEARYSAALEGSRDPAAFEELGILQRDRGCYGRAGELFEDAWILSGNGRHLSQMSEALRLSGDTGAALEAARRAAALRPDVETVWLQFALAARDAGNPGDALAAAAAYDSLFPEAGGGLWGFALEAALAAGDSGTAWKAAEMALSDGDTVPGELINAAGAALMADSTALAERRLLRASVLDPGNPVPPFDLALMALDRGDTAGAVGLLSRALEIDPGFAQAGALLGRIR
jgi:tetratricopeptide (TPR) repeat protein